MDTGLFKLVVAAWPHEVSRLLLAVVEDDPPQMATHVDWQTMSLSGQVIKVFEYMKWLTHPVRVSLHC